MNIIDIIVKKRSKKELSYDELFFVVDSYINERIPDYQMSAFLMAICINDMTDKEIFDLTTIFINSGDIIDFDNFNTTIVDKHSTGGVGDKTTLIVAPIVAACGVKVIKMSGKGLGHTGGTIDKLESIPGFNVNLSEEELFKQINDINVAIISQTKNLVPADKKIYALRDVSGTVESIPLIASSIMSKKIASGADKIVIDLKVGSGALIKNISDARRLANLMIKIGKYFKKEVVCIITNMNSPLGLSIGNSLEVIESIQTLLGKGPKDLEQVVITLATYMVSLGKNISYESAKQEVINKLNNREALDKFMKLVKMQQGDINKLEISSKTISIFSEKTGFINNIDAYQLGIVAKKLGAGRMVKDDSINYKVGIELHKQVNDHVNIGDLLATIYYDDIAIEQSEILQAYKISDIDIKQEIIYEIVK
jgi:pyrimidine-nucleoside phosphorylase